MKKTALEQIGENQVLVTPKAGSVIYFDLQSLVPKPQPWTDCQTRHSMVREILCADEIPWRVRVNQLATSFRGDFTVRTVLSETIRGLNIRSLFILAPYLSGLT